MTQCRPPVALLPKVFFQRLFDTMASLLLSELCSFFSEIQLLVLIKRVWMLQTCFCLDRVDTLDDADDYNKFDFGPRRDMKLTVKVLHSQHISQL